MIIISPVMAGFFFCLKWFFSRVHMIPAKPNGKYITLEESGICFLRQTADLEKPVLTLTVDKKDCCIFYKGFDNRNATEDEKNTLKQWAKARKLTLSENG